MRFSSVAALAPLAAGLLLGSGCQRVEDSRQVGAEAAWETEHNPSHVDSIFPIEEEIRRFRARVEGSADALTGGSASRDELVRRFMAALAAGERAAFDSMAISPAEFIHLYYPHTRFTRRPYEMAPGLVWFQLENYGSRGLSRALERFGGRDLNFSGYTCETLTEEGPNRLHGGCAVQIQDHDRGSGSIPLFGQILERDGRFKFINYAGL
jgi:hypothetical protein